MSTDDDTNGTRSRRDVVRLGVLATVAAAAGGLGMPEAAATPHRQAW